MKPTSDLSGLEGRPVKYAVNQPEYMPLPTMVDEDGVVRSRWTLDAAERRAVMNGAPILLGLMTFGQPLQPITMSVDTTEAGRQELESSLLMSYEDALRSIKARAGRLLVHGDRTWFVQNAYAVADTALRREASRPEHHHDDCFACHPFVWFLRRLKALLRRVSPR